MTNILVKVNKDDCSSYNNDVIDTSIYKEIKVNRSLNDSGLETYDLNESLTDNNVNETLLSSSNKIHKGDSVTAQLKDLFNKDFDVSELPSGYRLQSFTVTNNYVYVTAYDHSSDNNSILMVYDMNGDYCGQINLPKVNDVAAHVGGISYDANSDTLFITDNDGNVLAYDNSLISDEIKNEYVINKNKNFKITLKETYNNLLSGQVNINEDYKKITGKDGNLDAATTYYKDGKLYVATFATNSMIFVYDVSFDKNDNTIFSLDTSYGINNSISTIGIQGISSYQDENGNDYILCSSSYGKNKSIITKYKVTDSNLEFAGQKVFDDYGLEAIYVDDSGNVFGNFENLKYGSDGSNFLISTIDDISGSATEGKYMDAFSDLYLAVKNYELDKAFKNNANVIKEFR